MVRLKKDSVSPEKGKVPDAFRRVLRMEAKPRLPPYDRYSPEGLKAEREEAKKELQAFWCKRANPQHYLQLLQPSFQWSEYCAFAGIEFEYKGWGWPTQIDHYYPDMKMMKLFILLTESDFDGECKARTKMIFEGLNWNWDFRMNRAQLVRILSPEALTRLIRCLDGAEIAELFSSSYDYEMNKPWNKKEELIEKLAGCFDEREIYKLKDHVAATASGTVITMLKKGGKEAHRIGDLLHEHLKDVFNRMKIALGCLREGRSENEKEKQLKHEEGA